MLGSVRVAARFMRRVGGAGHAAFGPVIVAEFSPGAALSPPFYCLGWDGTLVKGLKPLPGRFQG